MDGISYAQLVMVIGCVLVVPLARNHQVRLLKKNTQLFFSVALDFKVNKYFKQTF